ncbi:hypothetical protein KIN20_032486 [Parelaphostrongylus tenuis]|uniref:Uncharacterized protein n=1 Tax=Parelaphostrongylus tenuis TaxID=148309 RepID=A0AAD5R6Y9_PARTN|nr:hypothetical protein KIN20_032486 [Parelaphostrongylus tenuis]
MGQFNDLGCQLAKELSIPLEELTGEDPLIRGAKFPLRNVRGAGIIADPYFFT